jgi:beta-N-acetylhexosaminidase
LFEHLIFISHTDRKMARCMRQNMGIDGLAGFVVQTGIRGRSPDDVGHELRDLGVNGLVLFKTDVKGESHEVRRRILQLRNIVRSSFDGNSVEPLIATDQEGGYVARIEKAASPSAMAFGAADDTRLTAYSAYCVASYLSALGINWNLAPVLDVSYDTRNPVIGTRSFGSEPEKVAEHGAAYVEGTARASVLSCGKHFPGHGRTAVDSHMDLPVIDLGIEQLKATDILPFSRAIRGGIGSIMIGHMYFSRIQTDDLPSSLSPDIVTGLLRNELGYKGLVVTDALEMHAVSDRFSIGESAVLSLKAGCDIVMTTEINQAYEAKEAIMAAVKKGKLTKHRLLVSRGRILSAMDYVRKGSLRKSRYRKHSLEELGKDASGAFQTASQFAVTSFGAPEPLCEGERVAVIMFTGGGSIASDPLPELFGTEAERMYDVVFSAKVDAKKLESEGKSHSMAITLKRSVKASGARAVLLCTRESHVHISQLEVASVFTEGGIRTIVAGMGTPTEAEALAKKGVREYFCAYSSTLESVKAVLNAIAGHYTPRGHSPLQIE